MANALVSVWRRNVRSCIHDNEKHQVRIGLRLSPCLWWWAPCSWPPNSDIYRITPSTAILSDALESIINVVASAFALGSILLAAIPPDKKTIPTVMVKSSTSRQALKARSSCWLPPGYLKPDGPGFLNPRPCPIFRKDSGCCWAQSLVNLALGLGLIRTGRKTRSLTLVADGKHVLTDVYTSIGVILGLFMVNLTGWFWMDGAVACLVGSIFFIPAGCCCINPFQD